MIKEHSMVSFSKEKYIVCTKRAKAWSDKAKRIRKEDVGSYMDRFIAYYISYVILVDILKDGMGMKGKVGDYDSCTKVVNEYCSCFMEEKEKMELNLHDSALTLGRTIQNTPFVVLLSRGDDPDLFNAWKNRQKDRFLSLLRALYYMRCNLFHGNKGLDIEQTIILKPAVVCLDILCKGLMRVLAQDYKSQIKAL